LIKTELFLDCLKNINQIFSYLREAIEFQIGADISKKYRIGYAFDYSIIPIYYTFGSHETVLDFMLK